MSGGGAHEPRASDPKIDLSGVTLETPKDYSDFVRRVLIFVDLSVTPLDKEAAARVMTSVVSSIISKVDHKSPNGQLMLNMVTDIITKGSEEEQKSWRDPSPATLDEVTKEDRASIGWGRDTPITKPLWTLLSFWANALGAVEAGARRAHSALAAVLGMERGAGSAKLPLGEYVERLRGHLNELHDCVQPGDVRDLLGLMALSALGPAEQTAVSRGRRSMTPRNVCKSASGLTPVTCVRCRNRLPPCLRWAVIWKWILSWGLTIP